MRISPVNLPQYLILNFHSISLPPSINDRKRDREAFQRGSKAVQTLAGEIQSGVMMKWDMDTSVTGNGNNSNNNVVNNKSNNSLTEWDSDGLRSIADFQNEIEEVIQVATSDLSDGFLGQSLFLEMDPGSDTNIADMWEWLE